MLDLFFLCWTALLFGATCIGSWAFFACTLCSLVSNPLCSAGEYSGFRERLYVTGGFFVLTNLCLLIALGLYARLSV